MQKQSTDTRYINWITDNVSDPYGNCAEYTLMMLAAFPELKRVRGHYMDIVRGQETLFLGEQPHWWLIDPQGEIVDPTDAQFASLGKGIYIEWDESQPEPTGKCPNC